MKLILWLGALAVANESFAAPSARESTAAPPKISQIVVSHYTGSDAQHPKADLIYRLVLRRDGSAIYVGSTTYMKRYGRYRGTIDHSDFERLAAIFQHPTLRNGPDSYDQYDGPEYKGRQVGGDRYKIIAGSHLKTIAVYEDSGPQLLRRAAAIQYGLLWKIRWQRVSESDAIDARKS